jgi:hypothetical protein
MNKNNFARKFCLFLEILSILCLFFFVWIIFSDWSNANIDPASASGADQPATGSMPGKGFAIFMFITCLNGNVLTILLFWFPHLSWRGKTIFEILYRQKDNRNEFEAIAIYSGQNGHNVVFCNFDLAIDACLSRQGYCRQFKSGTGDYFWYGRSYSYFIDILCNCQVSPREDPRSIGNCSSDGR